MRIKKKYLVTLFLLFYSITKIYSQETTDFKINYLINELNLSKKEISLTIMTEDEINKFYFFLIKNGNTNDNTKFIRNLVILLPNAKIEMNKYIQKDYPGINLGYPFGWWNDNKWIEKNLK